MFLIKHQRCCVCDLDPVRDLGGTHLSYFVGVWCWFLLLHVEGVPDPVSLLPGQDRLSLSPRCSNRDRFLFLHHKKAGNVGDSRYDGRGSQEPDCPQLEPSHHLHGEKRGRTRRRGVRNVEARMREKGGKAE